MGTVRLLEGKLRPIYEHREVAAMSPAILGALFLGPSLGLPMMLSYGYAASMTYWCYRRTLQGDEIKEYQKSLTKIEPFFMTTESIPHNSKETWIGRGFEWTSVHAQRMWDADKKQYIEYYELPPEFEKARLLERKVENDKKLGLSPLRKEARKAAFTKKRQHTPIDFMKLYSPIGLQPAVEKFSSLGVAQWLNRIAIQNHIAPHPPVGGDTRTHGVGYAEETDQYISLDERNGHAICFGQSRTGKSRFLEFLVSQDIIRNDGPVIVCDPKGDAELLARVWSECKRTGRQSQFMVFALGFPEISARYNAVAAFSRNTSVASRVAGQLDASGDSGVFKDFAWRFLLIVTNAMMAIGEVPSFFLLKRYIEDPERIFRKYSELFLDKNISGWRETVEEIMNPPPRMGADGQLKEVKMSIPKQYQGRSRETVARIKLLDEYAIASGDDVDVTLEGIIQTMGNEITYYNKITASLLPLLTKLTSGDIARLISPDYTDPLIEQPEFTWQKAIQQELVVPMLFDAMSDTEVATAVSSMVFQDLLSNSGEYYKHGNEKGMQGAERTSIKPIWVHIDEFHAVAKGGGGGEPFLSLANRSAGSGTRLTCYSQTLSDIKDAVGSEEAAGVLLGNFNSTFMLRVKTEDTAEYLTQAIAKSELLGIDVGMASSSEGAKLVDDDEDEKNSSNGDSAEWFNTRATYGVKSEDVAPIISPQTILQLPKGQAFAFLNAKRLVKLRFPLLNEVEGFVPPSLQTMLDDLDEKYERSDRYDGFE